MVHLHDGVILLLGTESLRVLLSCANYGFCYLNLTGMTKIKYERKKKWILVLPVKRRHRANDLLNSELLSPYLFPQVRCLTALLSCLYSRFQV